MTRTTNHNAHQFISQRQDFVTGTGSLSGHNAGAFVTVGHLPREYHDSLRKASYVVMSYATPIAWFITGEGWFIPEVSYSQTTSRHQNIARRAAGFWNTCKAEQLA